MGQKSQTSSRKPRRRPATTPEGRENQLIDLAVDVAEEQLRNGTASPSVVVHYLKLGTAKARKELEILEEQKKLIQAKTKSIENQEVIQELYANALQAMRRYSGADEDPDDQDL